MSQKFSYLKSIIEIKKCKYHKQTKAKILVFNGNVRANFCCKWFGMQIQDELKELQQAYIIDKIETEIEKWFQKM